MSRSTPEWVGKTPNSGVPPRVRLRVWERCQGMCGVCGRKIGPADTWIIEHLHALILGGENRESNLGVTCGWCKPVKDREDIAIKVKSDRVRKRHAGIKTTSRPMPGSRASGFKRKMNGEVVKR